jgi:RNA 3'-phosphate cyclase
VSESQAENILVIDGSFGEGGGQIIRTAVAFSAICQRPIKVTNIRAKRENPGLRPQHVEAIKAVSALCEAEVSDAFPGSSEVTFIPKRVDGNISQINVGTAGSITLILQTLALVASLAKITLDLEITGGTDVKWSPTINYFDKLVLAAYRVLGISCSLSVKRRGYYPVGGGIVHFRLEPPQKLNSVDILEKLDVQPNVVSICSQLPKHVAERQLSSATNFLFSKGVRTNKIASFVEEANSAGSSILVYAIEEGRYLVGADAIGERGKPAERVGKECAQSFFKEYSSGAPIDHNLGDMFVPFLSTLEEKSTLRVSRLTEHLTTNLHVTKMFVNQSYTVSQNRDGTATITIEPSFPSR